MSLPAPTAQDDFDRTDTLVEAVPPSNSPAAEADVDDASLESTIAIELNFKAFADQVPTTHHAKRVTSHFDPSIQDFADQALEIATIRAELKRLTREHEMLQQTLRQRDFRLETLREELRTAKTQLREATRQLPTAPQSSESASSPTENTLDLAAASREEPTSSDVLENSPRPHAVAANAAAADSYESTARLPEIPPIAGAAVGSSNRAPVRQLIPVEHDSEPVLLNRDIITIGRTKKNDLCIASQAVSRDHARLLIGRSVTIIDMDSANGCFVNDEPVKKHRLRDGDILRIGDRSYRLATDTSSSK